MSSQAQQSSVKFMAIGRLGSAELHDFYTPTGELANDQLVEECLKVLADNHLEGTASGDLHFHALKHQEFVLFLQHGNSRLDDLYELKLLEEINLHWGPEVKLVEFMTRLAEGPKKITRPPAKAPLKVPSFEKRAGEIIPTSSTSSELTIVSHRKHPASSVDQIKLMMAEDQRFSAQKAQRTGNPAVEAIKLTIMEDHKTTAYTPKTQETTTQRSSGKEVSSAGKPTQPGDLVILAADSALAETKGESTTESAVVNEELKKIKEASTNKKIFVVVILILAVIIFALVPVLTK